MDPNSVEISIKVAKFLDRTKRSTKETKGNANASSSIRRLRVTQVDSTGEKSDGREICRKKTTMFDACSRVMDLFSLLARLSTKLPLGRGTAGAFYGILEFCSAWSDVRRPSARCQLETREDSNRMNESRCRRLIFRYRHRSARLKYSRCVYRRRWILATDRFLGLSNSQMQIRFHRGIIRSFLTRYVLTLFLASHIFLLHSDPCIFKRLKLNGHSCQRWTNLLYSKGIWLFILRRLRS